MRELNQHIEDIHREWLKLQGIWENTQAKWRDSVATEFRRHQWQPLEDQIRSYLKVLEATCEGVSRAQDDAM